MNIYNQYISNTDEQMMLYNAMQMQQAYLYNYMMQNNDETEQPAKLSKKEGKRSYVQCELWKRQSLVEKVEKTGMTIKDAAKQLDINYSTAKHIMKVYRKTGEVETKLMLKRVKKTTGEEMNIDSYQEVQPQMEVDYQMQVDNSCYDMRNLQYQLPIDANMQDPYFEVNAFESEDKQNVHNFLFMSHCYTQ